MFLIEKGRKSPICRECKALHSKAACPKVRQMENAREEFFAMVREAKAFNEARRAVAR